MFNPLNLILQQWQGILRWALGVTGTALITKGVTTPDAWAHATPIIEQIVGGVINLVPLLWSVHSNQPAVIKSTADKLVTQGK